MAIEVPIPEWLHGPRTDPANAYLQAYHIGSQLAMEQSRLQQAQINADRDAQLQQQALQANLQRAEQEIANRHAYQQSSLQLRQQTVENELNKTKVQAAKAAAKFASQQRFAQGLRTGQYKNVEEALFDNPELMTPGTTDQLLRGKTATDKIHFGEGGLVQRYSGGKVETLVPGTPKPSTALDLARLRQSQRLPSMYQTLNDMDPQSPEYRKQAEAIKEVQNFLDKTGGAVQPKTAAPAAAVASPAAAPAPVDAGTKYPEGAILKHKDGSRWTVQGGKIIPLTEEGATPAAAPPAEPIVPADETTPDEEEEDAVP